MNQSGSLSDEVVAFLFLNSFNFGYVSICLMKPKIIRTLV